MDTLPLKTKDLGLAATLLFFGYRLANVDRSDAKRILFIFEQTDKLPPMSEVVNKYASKELTVEPSEFMISIKALKTIIYANATEDEQQPVTKQQSTRGHK